MNKVVLFGVLIFGLLQADEELFPVTTREMECIDIILYSLSEKNMFRLLADGLHLNAVGNEIDPVPPLCFLNYVLQKPELVRYLKNTKGWHWSVFISGFKKKCNRPNVYRGIIKSLDQFAETVEIQASELKPFVAERKWEELVKYLLKRR